MRLLFSFPFVLLLSLAAPAAARAQTLPTVTAQEINIAVDAGLGSDDGVVAAQAEETILRAGKAAIPELVKGMFRKQPARRRRCADLLGRIGDREAIDKLREALPNARDDEAFKLAVARALLALGSKDGIARLIELLESKDRRMRLRAQVALRRYTHRTFGFEHDAEADDRAAAVRQWGAWWEQSYADFTPVAPGPEAP